MSGDSTKNTESARCRAMFTNWRDHIFYDIVMSL